MTPPWRSVAGAAGLAAPDGTIRPTIFAEMSALAQRTGAANLGQGFPDADGPEWVREVAAQAIMGGANQYPPGLGTPELRAAIARHQLRHYGVELDPERQVLVTAGATEALAAAILALAGPGDEVVTLEPFYDSYAAAIAMAGADHVTVPLVPGPGGFRLDPAALDAAVGERTRLILVNTPHNPTGTVLNAEELGRIAEAAKRSDAVVVTDEVYEHLVYDGEHVPIASLPGAFERTLTISSGGKTFSTTGWKVGWVSGPAPLVRAVTAVKQFLTFVNAGPFQPAIALGLGLPDEEFEAIASGLAAKRDLLSAGLREAGFEVHRPSAGYFVIADAAPLGVEDAASLARRLPELVGVVGVPVTALVSEERRAEYASLMRFAFCKRSDILERAAAQLSGLRLP